MRVFAYALEQIGGIPGIRPQLLAQFIHLTGQGLDLHLKRLDGDLTRFSIGLERLFVKLLCFGAFPVPTAQRQIGCNEEA